MKILFPLLFVFVNFVANASSLFDAKLQNSYVKFDSVEYGHPLAGAYVSGSIGELEILRQQSIWIDNIKEIPYAFHDSMLGLGVTLTSSAAILHSKDIDFHSNMPMVMAIPYDLEIADGAELLVLRWDFDLKRHDSQPVISDDRINGKIEFLTSRPGLFVVVAKKHLKHKQFQKNLDEKT